MSLTRKSTITFLVQSVLFILSIIISVILARALGPTYRGVYALIVLIPTLIFKFGTLGIDEASVYYTGSKKYTAQEMADNGFFSGFLLGIALIVLFFLLMNSSIFKNFLNSNHIRPIYIWLTFSTVPFALISSFLKSVILGKEKIIDYNKIDIFQVVFQLLALLLFIVLFRQGILGATLSYVFAVISTALFTLAILRKIAKFNFSFRMDILASSIRYGWKPYIGSIAQFLNYRLNMLILAFFLPPAAVGYYSISILLAERLWMIPTSVGTVLFPRISSLEDVNANLLTPIVSRFTSFIVIIISALIIFIAKPLVCFLFGKEFLPAVTPFLILLPGVIIIAVAKILTSDLGGRGRPEIGMFSALASLAVNIPLNIILIPRWGISGSAVATSITYIFASLIVMISFKKISHSSWSDFLLIKAQDFRDYSKLFNLKGFFKNISHA